MESAATGHGARASVPAGQSRRIQPALRWAPRNDPRVSFEDALGVLLSYVGRRVDVAIESPASGLIAHFSGELVQGHELSPREDARASLFFSFRDGASGFIVAPDAVATATHSPDGSLVRIEDRAGVAVIVERLVSGAGV